MSLVGCGQGLLGAKGPALAPGGLGSWVLVLMLPTCQQQNPDRTHGSPAQPARAGRVLLWGFIHSSLRLLSPLDLGVGQLV